MRLLSRRSWLSLSTAALLSLLVGCDGEAPSETPDAPEVNTFKIGAVMPLSGQTATYGEESLNGLKMAIDDLSGKDGITFELVYKDNKGDSTETAKLTTQLIKIDKVDIIVGAVASTNTLKAAKVAQENGIPLMTPASTNAAITEKGDFISRICFIDPVQGSVLARLASEDLSLKKAVIIVDSASDYSVGLQTSFTATFTAAGGEIVSVENFTAGEADFSALITKVAGSGADVLFIPAYYGDVGPMLKQAGEKWEGIPIVAGDGIDSPDFYALMGDYGGDIYMSSHFSPGDTNPTVQNFVTEYKGRFGKTPGAMAALGYDAGLALFDARKRAGSDDPVALRDAINSIANLEGVTGSITINAERNADKDVVILKVSPSGAAFHKRFAKD
ncbi:MAG: branched-chain amino acid transport system substrate-binding protein [Myxococcota bacterium]|jgi:branched-chain amino acid transport system substrate-binding protein